jgi:translation elongation factor EF-Ts
MRIEIYYKGIKKANEAVKKLKSEGFSHTAVDLNDNYIDPLSSNSDFGINFSNVINSSGVSYTSSGRTLPSTSPMISGFGSFRDLENTSYKVIVNSNSLDNEKLKETIKKTGGKIKNYISNSESKIGDNSLL